MKKRIVCFLLAMAMVLCLLPPLAIEASATETYVVGNGVTIPSSDVPADGSNPYCNCGLSVGYGRHTCCWIYGYYAYYHIWGEYQDKKEESVHYLRNVPAEDRTLTEENLKRYLQDAAAGALVRIDQSSVASDSDRNGHTLIYIKMNEAGDGAILLEGNYDGQGRSRIRDWKFSDLVSQYGPDSGKGYQYIKYISWPDAPAYTPATEQVTVRFDAVGGSGAPDSISASDDGTITIPEQIPHQFGSNFYGWAASAGTSVAQYQPGDTLTVTEDMTLYALWGCHFVDSPDNISFSVTAAYPGQGYYIALAPQTDGTYVMEGLDESDTRAILYDAGGNVLAENDDANGTAQFQIAYDLYAGSTYYLYVSFYDQAETGQLSLGVSRTQAHTCRYVAYPSAPTCTQIGYTYYVCYECGDSYLDDILPATGHSYVDGRCEYCGEADPDGVLIGDANSDGIVNYLDAMMIAQLYVGMIGDDAINAAAADVNGDGRVDYLDAMMVAQFYVGMIESFA